MVFILKTIYPEFNRVACNIVARKHKNIPPPKKKAGVRRHCKDVKVKITLTIPEICEPYKDQLTPTINLQLCSYLLRAYESGPEVLVTSFILPSRREKISFWIKVNII